MNSKFTCCVQRHTITCDKTIQVNSINKLSDAHATERIFQICSLLFHLPHLAMIFIYNNNNIIIITMARQPYMGLGLLFPRSLCVRDRPTDVTSEPSGSQSGDLGEKWPLNFAYY
jgi:hypothetical protein